MTDSPLHDRLQQITEGMTFRAVAELTGVHAENVRRYMTGQTPSVEFLGGLCSALGISADWLLTGRGPMRMSELPKHAAHKAEAGEVLLAVAASIERLQERVDRIETYVQTLETRLRAAQENDRDAATPPPRSRSARARRVADALPERRPPAAD